MAGRRLALAWASMLLRGAAAGESRQPELGSKRGAAAAAAARSEKTLYGVDDRLEERDVSDAAMLLNGAASAALVTGGDLRFDSGTNTYRNRYQAYTLDYARSPQGGLCPGERYGSQPSLAYCSATLIGPDLVATAGHCLAGDTSADECRRGPCDGAGYIVFDFTSDSNGVFPAANVYRCSEVVHCVVDDTNCGDQGVTVDWAVIRLDRPVTGRVPVTLRPTAIPTRVPVYIIGHPSGLPRKYTSAHGASVLSTHSAGNGVSNYISNVDSFAGNSGSGMFDGTTHEFVGILVTGGEDWVSRGGCAEPHVCTMSPLTSRETGCPGEEAVSVDVLRPFVRADACTSRADCSGHGDCVAGTCACEAGYYAPDCSFVCDRAYCNNRGECTGWNECSCDDGALWPPLCSVERTECGNHADCPGGAYCSILAGTGAQSSNQQLCWECTDCDGYTCSMWGDSVDGSCSRCSDSGGAAVDRGPPVIEGSISCGETVQGTTVGASNRIGTAAAEHVYTFTISTAVRAHFDSCQSGYDSHLRVMSPDFREELASCDDCGPCNDRTVLDVDLLPGDYVLVVEGYNSLSVGEYDVLLTCVDETLGLQNISGTHGGCACELTWTISDGTCDDGDSVYHGCHAPPCDDDTGGVNGDSWCIIESSLGCNAIGSNWDYCTPGTTSTYSASNVSAQCMYANDGMCDEPVYCAYGTDLVDCQEHSAARELCSFARDGVCDEPAYCTNGTDVDDCTGGNGCRWAYDGECDEPLGYCEIGSDAYDCSFDDSWHPEPWEFEFDGNISCGVSVHNTTEAAGSHTGNQAGDHVYYFRVQEGGLANIQFNSCESEFDTFLRVVSHDLQTEYASCDDCGPCGLKTVLDTGALAAGEYALIVEGYTTSEGVYNVVMHCQEEIDLVVQYDGDIHCETIVAGNTDHAGGIWQSNVGTQAIEHLYNFTVERPGVANIEFDSCNSDFDTHLTVTSPDLQTTYMSCDDCGGCGLQAVVDTGGLGPGHYVLVVEGYGTESGNYSVSMTCQNTTSEIQYFDGYINCDDTVTGSTWEAGSHVGNDASEHIYYFGVGGSNSSTGVANIEFNSCDSNFDTWLRVFKHDLSFEYASCDDCGACGVNSVLNTGGLGPGEYVLVVEGWSSNEGNYSVSMACQNETEDIAYFDGSMSCGDRVNGSTFNAGSHVGAASGDHIYYFQVLEPGLANVVFDSCGSNFDTWLKIFDHNLRTEYFHCDDCGSCGTSAVIDTGFLAPGEYAVVIEGWSSSEGNYTLSMECFADGETLEYFDGSITCGDTVQGDTTGAGSHRGHAASDHVYFFSVENQENRSVDNFRFDACNSEFDTHLRVYSSDFSSEVSECDDCGTCGLQTQLDTGSLAPGSYALVIEGYGAQEGNYWVTMNCQNVTRNHTYTFVDTVFEWIDISAGGTQIADGDWMHDDLTAGAYVASDDGYYMYNMPFNFTYFDIEYSELHVGANGYSTFGHQHFLAGNTQPIPVSGGHADGMLAVFWCDLDPGSVDANSDSGVYVHGSSNRLVVSYIQIPYCCGSATPANTFQYVLYPNNSMVFQYETVEGRPPSYSPLSIGIENHDGTQGMQVAFGWEARPAAQSAWLIESTDGVPAEPESTSVNCEVDQFKLDFNSVQTCIDLSICTATEWEEIAPTPTTDRQCLPYTTCPSGQHEGTPPTATTDRLCVRHNGCSIAEFENTPPTPTTDRECLSFSECAGGQYEETPPSPVTDRQCSDVSACNEEEYELVAPTQTSDRECSSIHSCAVTEYEVSPLTSSTDRVCETATRCSATEFETTSLTSSSDRGCTASTDCTEDLEYEVEPLSETVDRQCRPITNCTAWQFEFASYDETHDRSCVSLSVCSEGRQFEAVAPGNMNDRLCHSISECSSVEYETGAPTRTTDRACGMQTVCSGGEFESVPSTPSSDRTCVSATECTADEQETVPPTATSDRDCICSPGTHVEFSSDYSVVCSPCGASMYDHDSDPATVCQACPAGASSVGGSTTCTEDATAVVSGHAEVQGAVSATEFEQALQELSGPEAVVEILGYEQTIISSITIRGGVAGSYDSSTSQGMSNLLAFRQVIADLAGVHVNSVTVTSNRRRRQQVSSASVELESRIMSTMDISAVFADTRGFAASLASGLSYNPADLYVQESVITTSVDHRETIAVADTGSLTAESLSSAAESLSAAMNNPSQVVGALEGVVGDDVLQGGVVTRATVSYSVEAVPTGESSGGALWPASKPGAPTPGPAPGGGALAAGWEEPDDPAKDPRLVGLITTMAGAVGLCCAVVCMCMCFNKMRKRRMLHRTAMGVGASGLGTGLELKSSYAEDRGQYTENNPMPFGAESANPAGTSPGGARP